MSQVTRDAPSRFTSSLQRAVMVWTNRRGGSTSRISPSPSIRSALGALRSDVPGDPGRPFALHVVAPEGGHGVDQSTRGVHLEDLPLTEHQIGARGAQIGCPR